MAKLGCKVYKRAGITHVCFNGAHYAPKDGKTTAFDTSMKVDLRYGEEEGTIGVSCFDSDIPPETWHATKVGNDNPYGYAKPKGAHGKGANKPKVAKPKKAKENSRAIEGAPKRQIVWTRPLSETEVDELLQAAAPNPTALGIMRVCWSNWLLCTVSGNRNLVPFAGLQWPDTEATERVQALGRRLMGQFKDSPVPV